MGLAYHFISRQNEVVGILEQQKNFLGQTVLFWVKINLNAKGGWVLDLQVGLEIMGRFSTFQHEDDVSRPSILKEAA